MHKITSFMMSAAFVVLALVAIAPNVSAATATYYLTQTGPDGNGHYALDLADAQDNSFVDLAAGASRIWVAGDSAAVDIDFESTTFTINLNGLTCGALGGSWVPGFVQGGTFTALAAATGDPDAGAINAGTPCTAVDYEVSTNGDLNGPTVLPQGASLAVQITDSDEGLGDAPTSFDFVGTSMTTGDTDPAYPTPSIATIALFSVGALMVAGAAFVNRRK